jgi:hypothetical protein
MASLSPLHRAFISPDYHDHALQGCKGKTTRGLEEAKENEMLKKLLIGGLIAIVLGVGAVAAYDLLRGDSTQAYQAERGQAIQRATMGASRGYQGDAAGDRVANRAAIVDAPTGFAGSVSGLADGNQVPQPQAEVTEWITVQGTVTAVELNALTIATADAEMMAVQLGPEHYWTAQGIALAAGNEVEITGFWEDEVTFSAGTVTLLNTGETLELRDSDGQPLWAGGSGLGGNGQGGRRASQ